MNDGLAYHIVTVGSLILFKLAVLVVGYLVARLGHDLLIKGVSGQFKFKAELQGTKADVASASPGIFFILMATTLMAVGVIKDKPFETRYSEKSLQSGGEHILKPPGVQEPPPLRPEPPSATP